MPSQNNQDILIPQASSGLDNFKYEIAGELGYARHIGQAQVTPQNFNKITDQMKYEIANELGLDPYIKNGYWGDLSSRACGAVGGRIGGKIGGNMVKRMIMFAEQNMVR